MSTQKQQLHGPSQNTAIAPSGVRHRLGAASGRQVATGTKMATTSRDFSSDLIKRTHSRWAWACGRSSFCPSEVTIL